MEKNKWDQWIESEEGKTALEPSILKNKKDETYLKNRLYWAFHAGNHPISGNLDTEAEALLKEVITRGTIPIRLRTKIRLYLNKKLHPATSKI